MELHHHSNDKHSNGNKPHKLPQQVNIAVAEYDPLSHSWLTTIPPFGFVLLHLDKDKHNVKQVHDEANDDKHTLACLRLQMQHDFTPDELIDYTETSHITYETMRFYANGRVIHETEEQSFVIDDNVSIIHIVPRPSSSNTSPAFTSLRVMQRPEPVSMPLRPMHDPLSYADPALPDHDQHSHLKSHPDAYLLPAPVPQHNHSPHSKLKAQPAVYDEVSDDEMQSRNMAPSRFARSKTLADGTELKITITGIRSEKAAYNNTADTVQYMYSVQDLLNSDFCHCNTELDTPIWISIENASASDYEAIGRAYSLHPLTVEDCQTHSTREKLEIFTNYLFLVLHALDSRDRQFTDTVTDDNTFLVDDEMSNGVDDIFPTTPIRMIAFSNIILSFHHSDVLTVDVVRRRLNKIYNNQIETTAWLIHAMLDCIVDSLLPVVESTSYEVDALDDLIYILTGSEHRDLLKRMGLTRRRLLFLRQRLWSKRDILMSLIGKDWQLFLSGVQVPYMRDVYDHVVTMLHKIDAASDLLQTLQSTYLANVSIDVSDASQRTNNTVKRLTAVVTIVSPLTLIAGLQGMNIEVPFQHQADNTLTSLTPYISLIGVFAAFMVGSLAYLKQQKLL